MRCLAILMALAFAGCVTVPEEPKPIRATFAEFLVPGQAVVFQIDHVPRYPPSDLATSALLEVAKDIGLVARISTAASLPDLPQYTRNQLDSLHSLLYAGDPLTWRSVNNEVVMHLLYATDFADNETQAGFLTYEAGTPLMVLFMDRLNTTDLYWAAIDALALSLNGRERAVLVHEFGHAIGLVNCGLPQVVNRQDIEHGCHSTDKRSSMFWALHNAEDPAQWILDDDMQPIWKFSPDDWADIRAYQAQLS